MVLVIPGGGGGAGGPPAYPFPALMGVFHAYNRFYHIHYYIQKVLILIAFATLIFMNILAFSIIVDISWETE